MLDSEETNNSTREPKNSRRGPIYRARRALIVGCGQTGATLATRLSDSGNIIKVLDLNPASFELLPPRRVETTRIVPVVGDDDNELGVVSGTREGELRRASAHEVDVMITTTGTLSINILASQIALHIIRVPKVLCLIEEEPMKEIYRSLGINVISRLQLAVDALFEETMA